MKLIRHFLQAIIFIVIITAISCKKNDNDFGKADTFTVDTIIVSPATDIDQAFEVGWAVTTTGYPAFNVKLYLSSDDNLDTLSDLKITQSGSVDINTGLNMPEETQYYFISPVTGTNNVTIFHNEKTSDPTASGWEESSSIANPSGSQKYIIGYFYNATGLQIQYGRRILAVPVTFK